MVSGTSPSMRHRAQCLPGCPQSTVQTLGAEVLCRSSRSRSRPSSCSEHSLHARSVLDSVTQPDDTHSCRLRGVCALLETHNSSEEAFETLVLITRPPCSANQGHLTVQLHPSHHQPHRRRKIIPCLQHVSEFQCRLQNCSRMGAYLAVKRAYV